MRTKTLLITAALAAAGAATSMAQGTTVFSVNAVGYIKLTIPPGFSIIVNQLNTGGNTVEEVFATAPANTVLYKYNGTGFAVNSKDPDFGWDDPSQVFNPGEGAFIRNPGTSDFTITLVGEVPQGQLDTPLTAGFNLVGSQVPQSAALDTELEFPAVANDVVYLFRGGSYQIFSNDPDFGWDPAEPEPNVGEGFFVNKVAATTWSRNFSVNTP